MGSRPRHYEQRSSSKTVGASSFREREGRNNVRVKKEFASDGRKGAFEKESPDTCRNRIRRENEEYDRKIHRSRSPNRPSNVESKGSSRSSPKISVRRSRSLQRRGRSSERRGRNDDANSRSGRRDRDDLRFEPPSSRFRESRFAAAAADLNMENDPSLLYNSMHPNSTFTDDNYRTTYNRFSPPQNHQDFNRDGVEFGTRPNIHDEKTIEMQLQLSGSLATEAFSYGDFGQTPNFVMNPPTMGADFLPNNTNTTSFIPPNQVVIETGTVQGFLPSQSSFEEKTRGDFANTIRKDKINPDAPLIPEFNPDVTKISAYEWVQLIDRIGKENDWKADEKQYIMASRLAGFAREWYLNTGVSYKNWTSLKQAFTNTFQSESGFCSSLQKMLERTKVDTETMASYFHHKVALLNACEIQGRKAVSCIIGGLSKSKIQEQIKFGNFEDPDELYSFLRSSDTNTTSAKTYQHAPPKDIRTRRPRVNKTSVPVKPKKEKLCYTCNAIGHLAYSCPLKEQNQKDPKAYNNSVMFGSLSQIPTYSKYFTQVSIKGNHLNGYVDQGSECTTIREETASLMKIPVRKEYKVIRGFSGSSFSSIGSARIALCVDRAIADITLYVIPDHLQAIPLIVGQSFSEQPHVVVMKDGDKIRFYQRMDNGETNFDF